MKVTRVQVRQGHPVPQTAYRAKGPFPQDIYAVVISHDTVPQSDNGGPELPIGSTAQNGWKEVPLMICSLCNAQVPANATESHSCG